MCLNKMFFFILLYYFSFVFWFVKALIRLEYYKSAKRESKQLVLNYTKNEEKKRRMCKREKTKIGIM